MVGVLSRTEIVAGEEEIQTVKNNYKDWRRFLIETDLVETLRPLLLGEKLPSDIWNSETGEIIIPARRKITLPLLRKLAYSHDQIEMDPSPISDVLNKIIGSFKEHLKDVKELIESLKRPKDKTTKRNNMKLTLGFTAEDVKHWAMEEVANLKPFKDSKDYEVTFPHRFTPETIMVEISVPTQQPNRLGEVIRYKVARLNDWRDGLSRRAGRVLRELNISTTDELQAAIDERILKEHPGCGKRTVRELEEYLRTEERKEEGFKKSLAKAIAPDIWSDEDPATLDLDDES